MLGNGPISSYLSRVITDNYGHRMIKITSKENSKEWLDNTSVIHPSNFLKIENFENDVFICTWRFFSQEILTKENLRVLNHIRNQISHMNLLIFFSSASVYGNSLIPNLENQDLSPINDYGYKKCNFENEIHRLFSSKCAILRCSNIFGLTEFEDFPNKLFSGIERQLMMQIAEPDVIRRDYIDIEILGLVVLKLISLHQNSISLTKYEILNVSSNVPISLNEVIDCASEVLGKRPLFQVKPIDPEVITYSRLHNGRMLDLLNDNLNSLVLNDLAKYFEFLKKVGYGR